MACIRSPFFFLWDLTGRILFCLFFFFFFLDTVMHETMGAEEKDSDELRYMLTETHPWVLLLTLCVSLLHTLFDVLAFKSGKGAFVFFLDLAVVGGGWWGCNRLIGGWLVVLRVFVCVLGVLGSCLLCASCFFCLCFFFPLQKTD